MRTSAADRAPWRSAGQEARAAQAAALPEQGAGTNRPEPVPMVSLGLERRLVRRAESLWRTLGQDGALPRLADASALLQPPFGPQAALVTRDEGGLRFSFVGSRLPQLGLDLSANTDPDRAKSPGARMLGDLAAECFATATPTLLSSEDMDSGVRARHDGPSLLLRALALPFAGADASQGGPVAVILIASWREFLSERDTRALHAELARAIARMRHG